MLKLKSIKKKNPPNFCKWEAYTYSNEYVVIRYKNNNLDVRIAKSKDDFLIGNSRIIYIDKLPNKERNDISLKEIVGSLAFDISEIEYIEGFYKLKGRK